MSVSSQVLWLSTSASLHRFDRPLLHGLSGEVDITQWQYSQCPDEASSLDRALLLLHAYISQQQQPVHLVGHGTGGLLGWLYAQQHSGWVRSLTLLSVGSHVAIDWRSHYYARRCQQPCSRTLLLSQMVRELFGHQSVSICQAIVELLEQDLDLSLSPHSLAQQWSLPPARLAVPLMVCGSQDDPVVQGDNWQQWPQWLNSSDRLWQCGAGRHFFHWFYPQIVGEQLLSFWRTLPPDPVFYRNWFTGLDSSLGGGA